MGNVSTPVDRSSPLWLAWLSYKGEEEYANTKRWALVKEHTDGSLWAAFEAGFRAAGVSAGSAASSATPSLAAPSSIGETPRGTDWPQEDGSVVRVETVGASAAGTSPETSADADFLDLVATEYSVRAMEAWDRHDDQESADFTHRRDACTRIAKQLRARVSHSERHATPRYEDFAGSPREGADAEPKCWLCKGDGRWRPDACGYCGVEDGVEDVRLYVGARGEVARCPACARRSVLDRSVQHATSRSAPTGLPPGDRA